MSAWNVQSSMILELNSNNTFNIFVCFCTCVHPSYFFHSSLSPSSFVYTILKAYFQIHNENAIAAFFNFVY